MAKQKSSRKPNKRRSKANVSSARKSVTNSPLKNNRSEKKKKVSRQYSIGTIKRLFASSSNQCAEPNCTNEIVVAGTPQSDSEIVGQICHIYAAADKGPRGNPNLKDSERNSFKNLILLCGHHHPKVDKQHKTYPAETLQKWKKDHEAKASKGTAEALRQLELTQKNAYIVNLTDKDISRTLTRIKQARDVTGFQLKDEALAFAAQLEKSIYSSGSDLIRAQALAWCARLLSQGDTTEEAKRLLNISKNLSLTTEALIAQAFITSLTNKNQALTELNKINSPEARSAAARVACRGLQSDGLIQWVEDAGLTVESFSPEGKYTLIINALNASKWEIAISAAEKIGPSDLIECPILLFATAMAKLMTAIPNELRQLAFTQVPFEADTFLLATDADHLVTLREARELFERMANFANEMALSAAANVAADYALWIGLRDPNAHASAMNILRDSMRDPSMSLRRINFALRFGIKLDIQSIEKRIDQNVALTGQGTADEAFARFSLALAQNSPKETAEYIEKHRAQLYEHLQKHSIQTFEIVALISADLIESAQDKLNLAISEGLSDRETSLLKKAIAEANGADPITERKEFYQANKNDIRALANLVSALEARSLWQDLLPHAHKMFESIPSLQSFSRVVQCLNELKKYGELYALLIANQPFIAQSDAMQEVWAWTLYREGRFIEAHAALIKLPDKTKKNARALLVNIAIASGAWDDLIDYCNTIWANRQKYSAAELLHTAQLSIAVNGKHSRELLVAAVEKDPNNPDIMAKAYFEATTAGITEDQNIGKWLNTAASLSDGNGVLKSISFTELAKQKPHWEKQAADIWRQLKSAKIPAFGAAQLLNRSLIELYLLPSLSNPSETDIRKRKAVLAYNGARLDLSIQSPQKIALDLTAIITLARLGILNHVRSEFKILIPHSTLGWLFQERQRATFHQPSLIKDAKSVLKLIANKSLVPVQLGISNDIKLVNEIGATLASLLGIAKEKSELGIKAVVVRSSPIYRLGSLMNEEADVSEFQPYICNCSSIIETLRTRGALTLQEAEEASAYLKLQELPQQETIAIEDDTEIYLDNLSVRYFQTTGVLEKLKASGLKFYVPQEIENEANIFLTVEDLGTDQLNVIENIRNELSDGISSGNVTAIRTDEPETDEKLFSLHPTYGVLGITGQCDAIVVDDRFINQHHTMTLGEKTSPLLTSLDILKLLQKSGKLTLQEVYAHRTALRQSGYQLIRVEDEELGYHLKNSKIIDGQVVETAELKAIRESLMLARINELVQLPLETNFLHHSLGAYLRAMKEKWVTASNYDEAAIFSKYLLNQIDIRTWAYTAKSGDERNFAQFAFATYSLQIISPPLNASNETRDAYYNWISENFLKPIKEYQSELYDWMVIRSREHILAGLAAARQTPEIKS